MHIYYEESFFRSFTKEELIGFTEFLCKYDNVPALHSSLIVLNFTPANTGGLLGLFMGFSVVSIIEILYFISLRPYCASRHARKKKDTNVKFVEPSKKVWFVEDVDHGKLVQLKQVIRAWDSNDSKRKVVDLRNAYNGGGTESKVVEHYPYRD